MKQENLLCITHTFHQKLAFLPALGAHYAILGLIFLLNNKIFSVCHMLGLFYRSFKESESRMKKVKKLTIKSK